VGPLHPDRKYRSAHEPEHAEPECIEAEIGAAARKPAAEQACAGARADISLWPRSKRSC